MRDDPETEATERVPVEVEPGNQFPGLTILTGSLTGRVFRLDRPTLLVGRSEDADIRIDEQGISRHHARLLIQGSAVELEDLNSTNGTFVGTQRVTLRTLLVGDQIQFGTVVLRFGFVHDLELEAQQALLRMATCDALTGAMNKGEFLRALEREVSFARRHRSPLSLALLDLDHFKSINDSWGHPAGDAVLVELARRVLLAMRAEDVFARYGGEEFAMIFRGLGAADAQAVVERVRRDVADETFRVPTSAGRRFIPVTLSAGLAQFESGEPEALLQAADAALYEAKRNGRNRVSMSRE